MDSSLDYSLKPGSQPPFPTTLSLAHGDLSLPVYLPDATFGVVRTADADDLLRVGVQGVVMNTFHLMQRPGSVIIQALGGLHRMSGWPRPILTDSGGFQAYSLIRQNAKFGKMDERGITFNPEGSTRKYQLTPEKCIQLQMAYDSDLLICLDDCTHVDASPEEQRRSVQRTIAWAKRCKREFTRLVEQKRLEEPLRPRLFGVIQGGGLPELRRECAEALLEIGFDGFGFGGWPLDGEGNLLSDILAYTRSLVPASLPMHALGVGHPKNVLACYRLGYGIFDSAMPTRDARHNRLYAFRQPQPNLVGDWLQFIYLNDERHMRSDAPISPGCDCPVCTRYSIGYLQHLFKLGDGLAQRLATLHNLRFMNALCDQLRPQADV